MDYGDTERGEPVSQGKRKPPGADRAGHAISPSRVGGWPEHMCHLSVLPCATPVWGGLGAK